MPPKSDMVEVRTQIKPREEQSSFITSEMASQLAVIDGKNMRIGKDTIHRRVKGFKHQTKPNVPLKD